MNAATSGRCLNDINASFEMGGPAFADVGVVALVPYRWSQVWQPCNHILSRLARYFHVVWMNPAQDWSDPILNRSNLRLPPHNAGPGFSVYQAPAWLPAVYRPSWLAKWASSKRLAHARERLIRSGCKKIVMYLWRPEFAAALDSIPSDLSCYHIDDEYSFSPVDSPNSEQEVQLIARVGQVFIHSVALLEKKGKINPHTAFAPNGVDFDLYSTPVNPPPDIASIPHPRIGYSGHIKKQLDWSLLLDLTQRHPQWSFVFVGSANRHPEITAYLDKLARRSNVHFLGGKTVRELSAYPQHFDVCIMPYSHDDYTKYIYPLKLHEYLATGRPVVGTPIASLLPFRHLLRLPETPENWSSAIADSLSPAANSTEECEARRDLASRHDWKIMVRRIAEIIAQRLGPEFSERFRKIATGQKASSDVGVRE
jgi:glycosyltransferase involved in cell wall biosynthesis